MIKTGTIQAYTADEFSVSLSALFGPGRLKNTVIARHAAMFLTRELTGRSLARIAADFSRGDHTTVINAIGRTIRRARDPAFSERLDRVRARVVGTP